MIKHSSDGTYKIDTFLPPEARNLTLEQVFALLVHKICQYPDDVDVIVVDHPRVKVLEFDVHPEDRRFVLGREGYIIRAFRTIAKAVLGPRSKDFRYEVNVTPDNVSKKNGLSRKHSEATTA